MTQAATCPQCSALVEMPPDRLSTSCPYCRTPLVAAQVESLARPDLVAPFVVTRAQASGRLAQHLKARFWAPERIRREIVPEKVEGLLLPFWVHAGVARSAWTARVGVHYWRTVRSGGKTRQQRETEWFSVSGTHVAQFEGQLVSASKGLPEAEANELEPFDLSLARPHESALVAGWIAELPTIPREQAEPVARQELRAAQQQAIQRFIPADVVSEVNSNTELDDVSVRLALLPAWIATYRMPGAVLRLLVNGQTGEVIGKVPVSRVKVAVAISLAVGIPLLAYLVTRLT